MADERPFTEETIQRGLASLRSASDDLAPRVLASIGGRTPFQLGALHATRWLPRLSAAAGLLLVLMLGFSWKLTPPEAEVDLAETDPAPIVLQFEEELDEATPSTVLTALVIEGMNP